MDAVIVSLLVFISWSLLHACHHILNFLYTLVQAGNIYLLDYAIMDGIPSNTIKGHPQYIAAPICLLYQHPDEGLIPIAIQVCCLHAYTEAQGQISLTGTLSAAQWGD